MFKAMIADETNLRAGHRMQVLQDWHEGRCAACGPASWKLQADHDHDTGYLRGLLCEGCNRSEPHGSGGPDSLWTRYRLRPPAVLLGVQIYWAPPDGAKYMMSLLGPDPRKALLRHQAETDPQREGAGN